jgi:hypothetical protein
MSELDGWGGRRPAPPGEMSALVAEIADLRRRLDDLQTGAPLRSASISAGGLTIQDGGNLTLLDGGDVLIDGGDLVIVSDEGRFTALHPDGSAAVKFGPLWLDASPGVTESRGMLVQAPESDNNRDIFRAKYVLASGLKAVYVGQSNDTGNVDEFGVWADDVAINGGASTYVRATAGFAQLEGSTGAAVYSPGQVQINSDVSQVFIQHGTTGSAANTVISTSGLIQRSTSSVRYKDDVRPLDLSAVSAETILSALVPQTWRDRAEVEADPETTNRYVGVTAEALHDAGLGAFVVYDDRGLPDAVSYDRLVSALAVITARQQTRLDDLTARLEALEAS